MTTTLQSAVQAQLGWTWRDHVGLAPVVDSNRLLFSLDLADGAEPNEADAVWHVESQGLAAGEETTLELDALAQELFGDTIVIPFARIKAILIVNRSAEGGILAVGGAEADEWYAPFGAPGDTARVMPGSPLLLSHVGEGWEVTPESYALKLAAVGGDVAFDVAVLGTLPGAESSSSSGI